MDKDFNFQKAQEANLTKEAKGLAKWLSVSVEILIFGHVIWSYKFPPESERKD